MPRDNSESGFSRCLVSVDSAIDRGEIFLAEFGSECAESARKFFRATFVIAIFCRDLAEDHPGERASPRVDSFRQFHCRVDIAPPPSQQCFIEDDERVARVRLERT